MSNKIFPIILEFCGGKYTDTLQKKLSMWNPDYKINVLDNGSKTNKCSCANYINAQNSFVGGGIRDCIRIAEKEGFEYILIITNDILPITKVDISYIENIIFQYPEIVQVGISLSEDSDKKSIYPWMINKSSDQIRVVPHCDILFCVLNLSFIKSFGGFPESKSGWGYDWEIAFHSNQLKKIILILDNFICKHTSTDSQNTVEEKFKELIDVYNKKYDDYSKLSPYYLI